MNDRDYMQMTLKLAQETLEAGEFPVGCTIVYQDRIIAQASRVGTRPGQVNEVDHAEMLALRKLAGLSNTIDLRRTTLYCNLEPCLMCYGAIILSGIGKLVYAYEDAMGGATRCRFDDLTTLYRDARLTIVPHVLREQSLKLFQQFFANPQNHYWQNSQLAQYTLQQ